MVNHTSFVEGQKREWRNNYERTANQRRSHKRYDDELLMILQRKKYKNIKKRGRSIDKNEEFKGFEVKNE